MSDPLQFHGQSTTRLLSPWDSPGKNTGVGCHALLQGIFLTQGSNPGLPHCRRILYCLSCRKCHLAHCFCFTPGKYSDFNLNCLSCPRDRRSGTLRNFSGSFLHFDGNKGNLEWVWGCYFRLLLSFFVTVSPSFLSGSFFLLYFIRGNFSFILWIFLV